MGACWKYRWFLYAKIYTLDTLLYLLFLRPGEFEPSMYDCFMCEQAVHSLTLVDIILFFILDNPVDALRCWFSTSGEWGRWDC
jgi:hypothetical protein